jgi:ATP-dependent exoDNAse (exonuclease V) beta subunit
VTDEARLAREDEQARSDALDVRRSYIVQAPAGSGKTELLIQRYLRLLAIVDEPEEIIAITFTRKAAAEMKIRVLQALQRARAGENPSKPHEKITADAARAAMSRDQSQGWQLQNNPRRMRIQTLDALNASIARMLPLTVGASAGNAIAGDAEVGHIYRSAGVATLDWLTETGPEQAAVRDVLRHVDNHSGLYVRYLARMLETRDQWLPFVGGGRLEASEQKELRVKLQHNLRRIIEEHLRRIGSAFPREPVAEVLELANYAARNLATTGNEAHAVARLVGLSALPDVLSEALPQWLGLAELLLTAKGEWRRRITKTQGFPPGDDGQKAALTEVIEELSRCEELVGLLHDCRNLPPPVYSDEQWSVLLALFKLLPLAVAELKRLFRDRRITDYIEIALAAGDAVGTTDSPGDMALLMDYQVRHILVDEMQDTSRAQYRMLEALTGGWEDGDGRTLFCVGDPMQSIYRFRNAEVGQFLLARSRGIGTVRLHPLLLRRNFRSGEFLVHWFNTVFPLALPTRDDPARGAVTYAESLPAKSEGSDCRIHPLFGADPGAEADVTLAAIRETLRHGNDDSVAVLVRSRTQLTVLLQRLRRAGIRWQAVDIDRLTDLPEIIEVLALARATVHPGDRLAWLALLRSPCVGWSWHDLHALVRSDTSSTIPELLDDTQRMAQVSDDARTAFERARLVLASLNDGSRTRSLRERIERAWFELRGPAILSDASMVANVYRFLDVLSRLEVAGTLQDVAELEYQLDQERVSGDPDARLQIMTMHRAKGLQFDHVVLMGLGRVPRPRERSVLSWYDLPALESDHDRVISPVGPRHQIENDPIHRFIELAESQKDRHESARLLYVACTRARKTLHLVGHTGLTKDREEMRAPDPRSLLHLIWDAIAPQFAAAFDSATIAGPADSRQWLTPVRRRIDDSWQLPQPAVIPGHRPLDEGTVHTPQVEYYWVGAEARAAGTVVHRWLQLATGGQADLRRHDDLRATTARWLRELGVGPGHIESMSQRVDDALRNVLADARGCWLLRGKGHAELALTGLYGGEIQSGVIDRIRIDDDGTHWIVDYKTGTHEGGDLDTFLSAEAERYRPQLARYSALYRGYSGQTARCALYFPLLQAFVEVEVRRDPS